ncbi:hypothetical protein N480_06470 [Pseudoalteromonas luteoviolacea S2607]|uniref:hypothetical protein n=1 Tax=Pseudoalteromonas luteoviolacea TaxID=43657 RepID=UPI0007B0644C|nr:hypothetical protein [Pseudoalteromonas luteoviolacea]KZN30600.1 hypothetical protein N480_06470 [Pseudoalteromonas luteoviolacea S2607]
MQLSELQIDYIKELFNVGLGEAIVELNDMINEEILMSVPNFDLFEKNAIFEKLQIESDRNVTAVVLPIQGGMECNGILLFPAQHSLNLVRKVLKETSGADTLTALEVESLTEISSIILDAIITSISDMMHVSISTGMPSAYSGSFQTLVDKYYVGDTVMSVGMHFEIKDSQVRGDILFVQDILVIEDFLEKTNQMLSELGL